VRVSTRIRLMKIGVLVALLAFIFAGMHFLLPAVATWRERERLDPHSQLVETARLHLWAPPGTREPRRLAEALEAFATALHAQYGDALALRPLGERITVRLFATQEAMLEQATRRSMTQDLSHAIGFYSPADWSIAATLRPRGELLPLLYHEATHLLMHRPDQPTAGRRSPWITEGVAVFFEQSDATAAPPRVGGLSRSAAAAIAALARRGEHVALRRLVTGGDALFASDRAPLAYRQAGALVAYLLAGADGRHRSGFLRYYREDMERGPAPVESLEYLLGVSIAELEERWLAYLQRNSG